VNVVRLTDKLLQITCFLWLLTISGPSFSDYVGAAFEETPVLLPDLRPKYDLLCGDLTSAQTLDLVDLNADGRKDILVGLWCGVPPGTTTRAPTVGALVAFIQNADKTFTDSTMSLFGSELVTVEKPFENIVYDFNKDGYDDVFMTMSREDGRADPWDVADNILNAIVMSKGDGTYSVNRTGCTQPCGTGYLVYEMDNEISGVDIITAPIGYGGSREVWRHTDVWVQLSALADNLTTGAMAFFERTSSDLASLMLAVSYKDNGANGVRLFKRTDHESDWSQVGSWITSVDDISSAQVTNWNGDVSTWPITLSEGKYFTGGTFEHGCELEIQSDTSLNLVYLQTAYQLDDYAEGMDIVEGQGMRWVYKLFGFSATETDLIPVSMVLQASVDLTDNAYRMTCEDVNGDGRDDIVVATWGYETHPHVYINTSQNNFSLLREEMWPPMGDALKNSQPVYADVDGDDIPDIIYFSGASVASSSSNEIRYQIHFGKRKMGADDTYDRDSDGVLNSVDIFPLDASETLDTDSDGIGNNADTDDDGDGLTDAQETSYGTNLLLTDTDGDGFSDYEEIADGTDPLDANSAPMSGLSLILIKAFLDRQEAASNTTILKGKLIAEYNIGANICLDKNQSLTCDSQEDATVTDSEGLYSLELKTSVDNEFLLAEISSINTKNVSGFLPDKSYSLMSPSSITGGSGSNNISTYTTILAGLLLDDPSINNSESTFNRVQRTLELSIQMNSKIDEDFASLGDVKAQSASEAFQSTLKDVQTDLAAKTHSILESVNIDSSILGVDRSAFILAADLAAQQAIYESHLLKAENSGGLGKARYPKATIGVYKTSVDVDQNAAYVASDVSGGSGDIDEMEALLRNGVIVAGSGEAAKLQGGQCRYDPQEVNQIEYLFFDNNSVSSSKFYLEGSSWIQSCAGAPGDYDTHVLSAAGWVQEQQFGANGYDIIDHCVIENEVPDHSVKRKYCATTRDFSGELISMVLPDVQFPSDNDRFPSNSLAFDVTWTRDVDKVEIYTIFAGNNGALQSSSDKITLSDFLDHKVDLYNQRQNADIWWNNTTNLRIFRYDDSSKAGKAVWYNINEGTPGIVESGSGDGWEVRSFRVRDVFGVPVAVFDRNGYSMFSEAPESFNDVPVLSYLGSTDAQGVGAGVYRGVIEAPNIPSTHSVGRSDLDRFTNLTFINAVFDSLELARLPNQN
jgi:hypothetical protein